MNSIFQSNQMMEAIARRIIKEYNPVFFNEPQAIPVEKIIENHYRLRLEYHYIRNNGRVLGETVFDDTMVPIYDFEKREYTVISVKRGTVIIDARLLDRKNAGRLRFTYAHELAHWIIHQEHYNGSGVTAAMIKENHKSSQASPAIERQADKLGSCILMPAGQVKKAFYRLTHHDKSAVPVLAKLFKVSKRSMEIKLQELHLLL